MPEAWALGDHDIHAVIFFGSILQTTINIDNESERVITLDDYACIYS